MGLAVGEARQVEAVAGVAGVGARGPLQQADGLGQMALIEAHDGSGVEDAEAEVRVKPEDLVRQRDDPLEAVVQAVPAGAIVLQHLDVGPVSRNPAHASQRPSEAEGGELGRRWRQEGQRQLRLVPARLARDARQRRSQQQEKGDSHQQVAEGHALHQISFRWYCQEASSITASA